MRGKDLRPRGPRGMKYRITPAETDLFCPYCLSQVVLLLRIPTETFLCERCKKRTIRRNILSFDKMISEKYLRYKVRQQLKIR